MMEVLFVSDDEALGRAIRRVLESDGRACRLMAADGTPLVDDGEGPDGAGRTGRTDDATSTAGTATDVVIVDDSKLDWTPERFDALMDAHPHARSLALAPSSGDGRADTADGDGIKADATLLMPFSDAELLAHVTALAAPDGHGTGPSLLIHGDLTLDLNAARAYYGDNHRPIPLSPREYDTLKTLIEANGRFMSFDELGRTVCGTGFFGYHDIMGNVLYSLTRKLRRLGFFITQRGDHYRIL